jgi:diguanylate cyclase (GGDEF)-like protein
MEIASRDSDLLHAFRATALADDWAFREDLSFNIILSRLQRLIPFDYAAIHLHSNGGESAPELLVEWGKPPDPEAAPWLALPLLSEGQPVGQVCLGRKSDRAFSELEQEILADYAILLAIALRNLRFIQQQQQKLEETQALLKAAQSILGAEDLPTICQNVDSAFHRLIQADRTSLYLVDHEERQVIQWAEDGYVDDGLSYEELDAGISGMVFRTGRPVLSLKADDGIEPEATRQRRKDRGVGSILVVPLIAHGQVIGTVTAANQIDHRKFNGHDVEMLMVLAANAAVAVDNVWLLEKMTAMSARLSVLSFQDALTGLYNRAFFEDELKRLELNGSFPVSIILLDTDELKSVNDRFGHAAGDDLLKAMAWTIREVFRKDDIAARIGGDEFGILLENVDQAGVEKAIERLRRVIEAYNESRPVSANVHAPEWRLSASIGAATASAGRYLTDVLNEADARMYAEKRSHAKRLCRDALVTPT